MVDIPVMAVPGVALPPLRPEYLREVVPGDRIGVIEQPLTMRQRLADQSWLRKTLILIFIALAWELYGRWLDNPLLVPTFTATLVGLDGRRVGLDGRSLVHIQRGAYTETRAGSSHPVNPSPDS